MNEPIKIIKTIFFIIIISIVIGYTYYQTNDYLRGPILELIEPTDNSTHNQSKITIKGYAKNISYISMNGRQIFTNQAGQFSEEILLSEGYNIISVSTKDKYERENQKILKLVYLVK